MEFCLHEVGHSGNDEKSVRHGCGSTGTMATWLALQLLIRLQMPIGSYLVL